jgi:hypothetical protein
MIFHDLFFFVQFHINIFYSLKYQKKISEQKQMPIFDKLWGKRFFSLLSQLKVVQYMCMCVLLQVALLLKTKKHWKSLESQLVLSFARASYTFFILLNRLENLF